MYKFDTFLVVWFLSICTSLIEFDVPNVFWKSRQTKNHTLWMSKSGLCVEKNIKSSKIVLIQIHWIYLFIIKYHSRKKQKEPACTVYAIRVNTGPIFIISLSPGGAYMSQRTGLSEVQVNATQIARFIGPIWGPPGADRTQVGPMLAHEPCYQANCCLFGVNRLTEPILSY